MRKCCVADPAGRLLLVFADDWGRHPSSCQHLIRQLLGRWQVLWVNTIGMRPPRFNWNTLGRGLEKLRHWTRRQPPPAETDPAPRVLNPRMWPWCSTRFDRWLNRGLLSRQLTPILDSLPARPIAITTLPITADLIGRLPVERWVYYCVDDFSEWPGLDGAALRRQERILLEKADTIVTVSDTLRVKIARAGRTATLLTHGVDLAHWQRDAGPLGLPEIAKLPRPLIVFWGVVDRRMDTEWVRRLADELTEGTILLLGPMDQPDPSLLKLQRVTYHPPVPFDALPALACEAAVLIMPYADLPVTRAMQPLKLKEYLATGRPTVVRDLPANRAWGDCLDLAPSPEAFSELVRERVRTGLPPDQHAARARLVDESWERKAQLLEQVALSPAVQR
jgi:glycosyltransferase involved in cell wall biosynthesis